MKSTNTHNRSRYPLAVLFFFSSLASTAVIAQSPPAANAPVGTLGGVTLSQTEVQRLVKDMPDADRAALQNNHTLAENWVRSRLTDEAVVKEARAKGWADRPEVKARVADAVRDVTSRIVGLGYMNSVTQVPADYPPEADIRAAYEKGKANFKLPQLYRVAQIFINTQNLDKVGMAAAREKAKKLDLQARQGDFAELARINSDDAGSAQRGGEVGTLPLENLLPALRDSIARMKKGQVSDVLSSDRGLHIIKLLDSQPPRTATYDEMKPRLQVLLRQQRQQQAAQAYLATLAPASSMKIDGAALDAALGK